MDAENISDANKYLHPYRGLMIIEQCCPSENRCMDVFSRTLKNSRMSKSYRDFTFCYKYQITEKSCTSLANQCQKNQLKFPVTPHNVFDMRRSFFKRTSCSEKMANYENFCPKDWDDRSKTFRRLDCNNVSEKCLELMIVFPIYYCQCNQESSLCYERMNFFSRVSGIYLHPECAGKYGKVWRALHHEFKTKLLNSGPEYEDTLDLNQHDYKLPSKENHDKTIMTISLTQENLVSFITAIATLAFVLIFSRIAYKKLKMSQYQSGAISLRTNNSVTSNSSNVSGQRDTVLSNLSVGPGNGINQGPNGAQNSGTARMASHSFCVGNSSQLPQLPSNRPSGGASSTKIRTSCPTTKASIGIDQGQRNSSLVIKSRHSSLGTRPSNVYGRTAIFNSAGAPSVLQSESGSVGCSKVSLDVTNKS